MIYFLKNSTIISLNQKIMALGKSRNDDIINSRDGAFAFDSPNYGNMQISTGNDLPGYTIIQNLGLVYGTTVRSRHVAANIGAGLKSLVGGELKSITKNVVQSRNQALERMISAALALGANGIYAFRFDCGSIGEGLTEICCYGTAVIAERCGNGHKH